MAFYILLILTIIWFILMTYLSHQDGEHTGRTSYELAERLSFLKMDTGLLNGKLRRAAHIVVFEVFTVLLGLTLRFGGYPLWPVAFTAVWTYIDEVTKPLIQGRHFSWIDVGLNLVGVIIGGVILAVVFTVMFRSVQLL